MLKANAAEVATGKFYANAEEYWSDRPDTRPVPLRPTAAGDGAEAAA